MSNHHKYRWTDTFETLCAIWNHLYNLKNMKNIHGGALLLVKLQATKSNTPPWVFFKFFKRSKWYQIAPSTTFIIANIFSHT